MTDAKIKELERHVLALREAVIKADTLCFAMVHELSDSDMEPLSNIFAELQDCIAATTDTAQAGREAEARIIDTMVDRFGGPTEEGTMVCYCNVLLDRAKRLRNGGSDDK